MLKLMLVVLKTCLHIATLIGGKRGQIIGGVSYLVFMATLNIGLFALFYIATEYFTGQYESLLFTVSVASVVHYVVMWLYGRTITDKEVKEYSNKVVAICEDFFKLGEVK